MKIFKIVEIVKKCIEKVLILTYEICSSLPSVVVINQLLTT